MFVMDCRFVFPQNSYVKTITSNGMESGGRRKAFERQLGITMMD
jgi:hypothetical protein